VAALSYRHAVCGEDRSGNHPGCPPRTSTWPVLMIGIRIRRGAVFATVIAERAQQALDGTKPSASITDE
ncbi:hypothetical protein, partial [Streptomyces sp. NPDC057284]|uniref:hypothetical protein n=1 Tax=Streptomyces sp. NPDC057284 TaxID=3346083 RepID=UPI00362BED9F